MGSLLKPKMPAAPDPVQTAQAQTASNEATARLNATLNRVNQYTPYGTSTWQDLGGDRWAQTTTLTPLEQQAANNEMQIDANLSGLGVNQLGRVSDALSQKYSYDSLPQAPDASVGGWEKARDALYNQAKSRLDPEWSQNQTDLETKLANNGIPIGSEAYSKAMDDFNRGKNDAYGSAMNQAIAAGGQEQSRLFGLGQAARNQAIQEYNSLRSQPLNELTALASGSQVTQPSFQNYYNTNVANTDVAGITNNAYAGQLARANSQQQRINALIQAGGQAAGAMAMA